MTAAITSSTKAAAAIAGTKLASLGGPVKIIEDSGVVTLDEIGDGIRLLAFSRAECLKSLRIVSDSADSDASKTLTVTIDIVDLADVVLKNILTADVVMKTAQAGTELLPANFPIDQSINTMASKSEFITDKCVVRIKAAAAAATAVASAKVRLIAHVAPATAV